MAFDNEAFIASLETGESVPISDIDFGHMEDALVHAYLPPEGNPRSGYQEAFEYNWAARERLATVFRVKGFHGRLIEPYVQLQPDPLELLESLGKAATYIASLREQPESVTGIILTAGIKSTRADVRGQITRPIWYRRAGSFTSAYNNGKLWTRIVGDNIGENTVEDVLKKSRRLGASAQRGNGGHTTAKRRVKNK